MSCIVRGSLIVIRSHATWGNEMWCKGLVLSGALALVWVSCPTLGFGGQQVFEVRFDARITVEAVVSDLERLGLGPAVDANALGKPELPWLTAFLPKWAEVGRWYIA